MQRQQNYRQAYRIAMAAGQDAGNRHAERNGRSQWNEEDWDAAADAFQRVMQAKGYMTVEWEPA